jgi:glycosyltransferase involved in cell wall biosynthesis
MSHNMLRTETGLLSVEERDRLREALRPHLQGMRLVFISEAKREDWGLGGRVIRGAVDPAAYGDWRGDIPRVLSVGNYFVERDFMLGYSVQQEILGPAIGSTVVGQNPQIAGARLAASWDELKEHYRSHRLYLNTTIEQYESGYNLSMLEAMATGMPVVTLTSADSPIIDGVNGFISGNLTYLRSRIELLLRDVELARRLGQAARQTVIRDFNVQRFAQEWDEEFAQALQMGSDAAAAA